MMRVTFFSLAILFLGLAFADELERAVPCPTTVGCDGFTAGQYSLYPYWNDPTVTFPANADGVVDGVTLVLSYFLPSGKRGAPGIQVKISLYDSESNVIGVSEPITMIDGDLNKQVLFVFASPVPVTAGDDYVIRITDYNDDEGLYWSEPDDGITCPGTIDRNDRATKRAHEVVQLLYRVSISCGGSTSGDPHFYGFKNQKYDVMGQSFEIYNIISLPYLQINSRFIPYYKRANQIVPTGTMMGELGVKLNQHKFHVMPNETYCTVDNQQVSMATNWKIDFENGIFVKNEVKGKTTYFLTIASPDVTITFIRKLYTVDGLEDQWHYDYKASSSAVSPQMHGLLGQTWEDKEFANKEGAFKFLDGVEDDYRIASNNIFGDDFTFNKFLNL